MRVLRVYHGGRSPAHRKRDRALAAVGVELTLVVPSSWSEQDDEPEDAQVDIVQIPVKRSGDVNRHSYRRPEQIAGLAADLKIDLLDIHEEPFSAVVRQLARALPEDVPLTCYSAQNLDKRFPPPFAQWERQAFGRLWGIHTCSRQAASVVTGKGYRGITNVLALGTDSTLMTPGRQSLDDDELSLGLIGRLVPEKGLAAAVEVLRAVNEIRPARLHLVGDGPALLSALTEAGRLGISDQVTHTPWIDEPGLAQLYRKLHWVLVPSLTTRTWVEQFGRVVTEAQACGAVVAGFASGSLPEIVGDTGVLAPTGDVRALTAGVVGASQDGTWALLRAAGITRAPAFTWAAVAADQRAFYDTVLTAGPPAAPLRDNRARAVEAFGRPARGLGSSRPFALPLLRNDRPATRLLARAVDRVTLR